MVQVFTSAQVDQKLITEKVPNLGTFLITRVYLKMVSSLDTILLPAMMARSEKLDHDGPRCHSRNFGPCWSEVGNSLHDGTNYLTGVESKNVRQVGAHFREAHRNKVAPSWRSFYRSPLLKMWDNLSHISKEKANNRK